MDYSDYWKRLSSENTDIQGGGLITTAGVLIRWAEFSNPEDRKISVARCAGVVAIASQLVQEAERGEFEAFILEGEHDYVT